MLLIQKRQLQAIQNEMELLILQYKQQFVLNKYKRQSKKKNFFSFKLNQTNHHIKLSKDL
jgi:hypothetical protein